MSDKVISFLDRSLMLMKNTQDNRRQSKTEVKIEDEEAAAVKRASTLAKNLEQVTKQKQQERKQAAKPKKNMKSKPPVKPQLPSKEGQQAIANIRINKSISGQGYGAYSKPTKKYNLMRGSAMAGNNNKQLLKQIQ